MTTILIVDDDAQLPQVLARVLAQYDFEIQVATNARDGLAAATTHSPDVVLLDVNLGSESGLDLQRALRETAERPPAVIFMTSRRDVFPEIVPQLGPADDWIIKPWDPAELLARVRLAAKRAAEHKQPE
jgi:DNA-binding response OmpR family regulator